MQESDVTNSHFRNAMNQITEFFEKEQEPPAEVLVKFIAELKVSNLLTPGIIEDNGLITENIVDDESGRAALMLYTDDEEFIKDKGSDSRYDPIPNDIRFYLDWIEEEGFDGVVINYSSECFYMPLQLLSELPLDDGISITDSFTGYGPDALKGIAQNPPNDSIADFIKDPSNERDMEGLMLELSKSALLDLIISEEDFENHQTQGIVDLEDIGDWDLCMMEEDGMGFGILFTGMDAINDSMDPHPGYHYACRIAVLSEFFDEVLRRDVEGIFINPGLDDYFIPRGFLLAFSSVLDNPSFKKASRYAFLLSE